MNGSTEKKSNNNNNATMKRRNREKIDLLENAIASRIYITHFVSIIHRRMLYSLYLLRLIYFLRFLSSILVFCSKLSIMFHCNFNKCPLNVWFTLRSYLDTKRYIFFHSFLFSLPFASCCVVARTKERIFFSTSISWHLPQQRFEEKQSLK